MHRLFFALYPDPPAAAAAARLARELRRRHGLTGPVMPAARLHVSLNGLGEHRRLDPRVVDRAILAGAGVRMAPFLLSLDQLASFRGPAGDRPLVLLGEDGVIGAYQLHAAIHAALVEAGLVRRPERAFTPHLTLLRDAQALAEAPVEPVRWTVREFVLLDSPVGRARHEVLARWPLAERRAGR